MGGDISKLYHSMVVAPPHQYLAVYRYIQENVNAMVHMGRHATYEWLPGKEVLLATYDFPEVVEGNIPQIYYYIVDGLAEGIQAKRRGSAVIIDHLTPPMVFTALYGGYGHSQPSSSNMMGQRRIRDQRSSTGFTIS